MAERFSGLMENYPAQSQQNLNAMNAATTAQMRQSVAKAAVPLSTEQAQGAGAQAAAQQGQNALNVAETQQKKAASVGKLGLGEQQMGQQKAVADKRIALAAKQRDLSNKITQLGEDTKNKILDSNLSFQQDELGRTQWNERQLMDYKLKTAQSQEDFYKYRQQVQQTSARKTQLLKASYAKINEALKENAASSIKTLDQDQQKRLLQAKYDLEMKMKKDAADAANRGGMFQAGGAIAGTVVGAYFGGPMGAAAGGAVGGAAGTIVGQQTEGMF